MAKEILAWHILANNAKLSHMDDRVPVVGWWESAYDFFIEVDDWRTDVETPTLCRRGMHGSRSLIDALYYAKIISVLKPGAYVCRVRIRGGIRERKNKLVGLQRKILWYIRLTRKDVVHLDTCENENAKQLALSFVATQPKITKPLKQTRKRAYTKPNKVSREPKDYFIAYKIACVRDRFCSLRNIER
jgi:hypothetical protein